MWFLLLVALASGEYQADSVYATQEECQQARTSDLDICAAVKLSFIELPPVSEIVTSKLPAAKAQMP